MKSRVFSLLISLTFGTACAHIPRYLPYHDPLDAQEHLRLGNLYDSQGQREDARRQFEAAKALDPGSPEPFVALGNLEFEQGHIDRAETLFRAAIKKDSRSASAANNLAMVCLAKDKIDEAENWAQRALWQNSAIKPYVLDTLAEVYLREKRYAEAETAAEQALASAPAGDTALTEHLLATRRRLEALAPSGNEMVRP